jgi:hypothetical protein
MLSPYRRHLEGAQEERASFYTLQMSDLVLWASGQRGVSAPFAADYGLAARCPTDRDYLALFIDAPCVCSRGMIAGPVH